MKSLVIIARLYAAFIALITTLTFTVGVGLILDPRPWLPDDSILGWCMALFHLPFAIISWWHALYWRPKW